MALPVATGSSGGYLADLQSDQHIMGRIISWNFHSEENTLVSLNIWRPQPLFQNSTYRLVSKNMLTFSTSVDHNISIDWKTQVMLFDIFGLGLRVVIENNQKENPCDENITAFEITKMPYRFKTGELRNVTEVRACKSNTVKAFVRTNESGKLVPLPKYNMK